MDLADGDAVHMALRLSDHKEHVQDVLSDVFRNIKMIPDDMLDIMHPVMHVPVAMVMAMIVMILMVMLMVKLMLVIVMMLMVMLMVKLMLMLVIVIMVMIMAVIACRLFNARDLDFHVRSQDPAFDGRLGRVAHVRDADRVEHFDRLFTVRHQFQQSGRQHVAGSAHSAVQI